MNNEQDQLSSNEFLARLLRSDIPMKLYPTILAYVSLGAWQTGKSAFLSYSKMEEFGMNRKTLYRHTAELQELGSFEFAGYSREGFHRYRVTIPDRTDCPTS